MKHFLTLAVLAAFAVLFPGMSFAVESVEAETASVSAGNVEEAADDYLSEEDIFGDLYNDEDAAEDEAVSESDVKTM